MIESKVNEVSYDNLDIGDIIAFKQNIKKTYVITDKYKENEGFPIEVKFLFKHALGRIPKEKINQLIIIRKGNEITKFPREIGYAFYDFLGEEFGCDVAYNLDTGSINCILRSMEKAYKLGLSKVK